MPNQVDLPQILASYLLSTGARLPTEQMLKGGYRQTKTFAHQVISTNKKYDIKTFLQSSKGCICWRYVRFLIPRKV